MSTDNSSRKNVWTILVAVLLLVILAFYTVAFVVPAGQWGVVRTLGRINPDGGIKENPGLYFKAPWPFQTQQLVDRRLRFFEDPGQEALTRDKFNIHAALVVGWRVTEPGDYLAKLQNEATAELTIRNRILNMRENAIKSLTLDRLITTDPAQAENFSRFENDIRDNLQDDLRSRNFGVQVEFLRVKTLRLTKNTTEAIQRRMSAERRKAAATFKAEGESQASARRIQARAEADRRRADAVGQAIGERAKGVAESAQYYRVFNENPELANRLKEYDILGDIIKPGTTIILESDKIPGLAAPGAAARR